MARSELGQRVLGVTEQAGGIVSSGLSVVVNPTPLEAPATEAVKVFSSLGSGSLPEIATTFANAPFEIVSSLAKAGAPGIAALVLLGIGVYLIGDGRVRGHEARRGAGRP